MELDLYQQVIHKTRYAKYIDEKSRREHWPETVDRYITHMKNHVKKEQNVDIPDATWEKIRKQIVALDVMPSMRAIMSSGKALERDNTSGYNCAYVAIDDQKAFDEALHILMCGTGVGFSVERQYIAKLPEVPAKLYPSDTTMIVKDSKEGWAKGLRQLIALLYSGEIPNYDLTKLRPAGAKLKTFGGRSSGPGPLDDLFKFVIRTFKGAVGRKLNSIECHDIMCKIGEVVVVGGVRRAALISLSNLSDDRMRHAKSGAWWEANVQRALSNNSAVYTEKPDVGIFMKEWLSLYESKSGERGIINRQALQNIVARNGRRDPNYEFGVNPCAEIILRPNQFCNLTEVVVRADDTMETLMEKVEIAAILGTLQSTLTYFPYLRKVWTKNTEEERLLGVSLTGVYDNKMLNNYKDKTLAPRLQELRQLVIDTNKKWAELIGVPQSTAVTANKPSGTVSELVDCASGIHPRHDSFYYRRVRNNISDPVTQFLINAGVEHETDVTNPRTIVFTFPKKAPKTSKLKDDISAIDHLELWLAYQDHWCEHKPSVTISVKEEEWMEVGAWCYKNFDKLSGVSFLPFDGGTYRQAPYESIDETKYNELLARTPKELDWNLLNEDDDNVAGTQALACTSGCNI